MIRQVINVWKRTDGEQRIPVLKLEIDYELMSLYDALVNNDEIQIEECKQKLQNLRLEMIRLEA
ncbi:MAG: hypothetical protein K0S51_506 [Bacillales bacterium]|jgi:hypothetical protein|nr:hypothetical protein [Bacillales bacterium]